MKVITKASYIAVGFIVATFVISFWEVGAQISDNISSVFISNDHRNPIPIVSKEEVKIKGEVKIDGKPEVKLDGDTKIRIESIEKPINVRFDKDGTMPETGIFKTGKKYLLTFAGNNRRLCSVEEISGIWIRCGRKQLEGEIRGWVNTTQLSVFSEQ